MLARQEGLTTTYNRFHNPEEDAKDIVRLRELHVEMDKAVTSAYGWDDLELGHDFHETAEGVRFTVSEAARREILSRLLKLSSEQNQEEQKEGAVVEGAKKKAKKEKNPIAAMPHRDYSIKETQCQIPIHHRPLFRNSLPRTINLSDRYSTRNARTYLIFIHSEYKWTDEQVKTLLNDLEVRFEFGKREKTYKIYRRKFSGMCWKTLSRIS